MTHSYFQLRMFPDAWKKIVVLILLATVAYLPSLTIPLIEDDYPNIAQATVYGPISGIKLLFADAVFRLRATSYWAMYSIWHTFGLAAPAYHVFSVMLHIANTLLLYRLLLSKEATRNLGFWAASFFAVYEGHQEAVMWFSAINELLMFFFLAAALCCWLAPSRPNWWSDAAGVALFGLALISKESAVILLPGCYLATHRHSFRRRFVIVAACTILTLVAIDSIYQGRATSFRFSDGSFSLAAPFWITLPRSMFRLLWFWGLASLAVVIYLRERNLFRYSALLLLSMSACLIPYGFLTYSTAIPSRQVYLASGALAVIFGLAMQRVAEKHRGVAIAVLAIVVCHNCLYLWIKKQSQFLARAAPTERLITELQTTRRPVWIKCFPRSAFLVREVASFVVGTPSSSLVWSKAEALRRNAVTFSHLDESGACRTPSGLETEGTKGN